MGREGEQNEKGETVRGEGEKRWRDSDSRGVRQWEKRGRDSEKGWRERRYRV